MAITTTLNDIRKHSPCIGGWEKLLNHLGKTKADDEPLKFSTILESNGVEDAYWCLRALPKEHDKDVRLLAADVAERVLHIYEKKYPDCDKPRKAIQAARDYANGLITPKELEAARDAAWAAADAATWDARDAAWDAAVATARDARAVKIKAQGELLVRYFG